MGGNGGRVLAGQNDQANVGEKIKLGKVRANNEAKFGTDSIPLHGLVRLGG